MSSDTQVLPEAAGQDEVLHADRRVRKDAVLGLFLVAVVGSLAIGWVLNVVLDNLERTAAVDPQLAIEWARTLLASVIGTIAALGLATGVHTVRFAARVMESAQFPPPGTRVLNDTRIRQGSSARALGRVQSVLGIAIVAVSVLLLVWTFLGLPALVIR
jgi:hypothetical protein